MRYTPQKIQTTSPSWIITDGSEYITLDGTSYTGYCNLYNGVLFTGVIYCEHSEQLFVKTNNINNSEYSKFTNISTVISSPKHITPSPSTADFTTGKFIRYFVKRVNDPGTKSITEIDILQFTYFSQNSTYGLYQAIQLDWKLTGPLYDVYKNGMIIIYGVYDTNQRTINLKEKELPGISLVITDFTQFAEIF